MGIAPRISTSWASMRIDRSFMSTRGHLLRGMVVFILAAVITYLVFLPFIWLYHLLESSRANPRAPVIPDNGEDALKHFAGSRDCGILQSDIYIAPWPAISKVSPFCKNRATLLEALSGGGRHGFDESYVGKGCTYRWFSTTEICMILERFNAITFIGDDIAQSIYAGLNVLLREDLVLGGLQQWMLSEQERRTCKCENQFLNADCREYAIRTSEQVTTNEARKGSSYFCSERTPHAYIPVNTVPAAAASQNSFKDLTYSKPNPWQPSPMIFSFGHGSSHDVAMTTKSMDEWTTLATAAERNIPMLFLGPPAVGLAKSSKEASLAVWKYMEEVVPIAEEKHFEVLGLYNLTLQVTGNDGGSFGEKVALVETMMIINWLSKLDTS